MSSTRQKQGKYCSSTTCNNVCDGVNSEVNLNTLFSQCDAVQPDNNTKKQRQLDKLKNSDDIITCPSFGTDRYNKYQGYHFCTPCWEVPQTDNRTYGVTYVGLLEPQF